MFANIVTNVGNSKKPWEDVPVEVLIEEERKKKEALEDHREQLQIPVAPPIREPRPSHKETEGEEDHKIVIQIL